MQPEQYTDNPREGDQGQAAREMNDAIAEEAHHAVHALDVANMRPVNEFRRSVILTAGTFAMICASTSYAFNIFSGSLQKKYNYDSRAMSTINTVGMVFAYFLAPYGFIYDYLGPLPIYIIACSLFTIGALLLGLTFQGVIEGSVAKLAVFNAFLSLGSQLFDLATVVTVLLIFPTRRGWVIGIMKTMMGLGSAIIGSIQIGFFKNSPAHYFYFLIALVVVVSVIVMPMIKQPSYELTGYQKSHLSPEEKTRRQSRRAAYLAQQPSMMMFYLGMIVIVVLIIYLPVTSALVAFLKLGTDVARIFAIVTIILTCLILFMLLPFHRWDRKYRRQGRQSKSVDSASAEEPAAESNETSTNEPKKAAAAAKEVVTDIDFIAPQYQTTFFQSLKTLKFWCIFFSFMSSTGAAMVIIFNARFIYAALDGKPVDDTVGTLLTVINGAASAVGRIAISYFEAWTQSRGAEKRMPITLTFFASTTIMILSIIFFLVLPGRSLLLAYAMASFGNGVCAGISVLAIRTIYAKDPARHYNFSINALALSAVLLNRLLYGEWYAVKAAKLGETLCLHKSCVLMPLLVMLGLNVIAYAGNIYIHYMYISFCKEVLAERRRIKEARLNERLPDVSGDVMDNKAYLLNVQDAIPEELINTPESDEAERARNERRPREWSPDA